MVKPMNLDTTSVVKCQINDLSVIRYDQNIFNTYRFIEACTLLMVNQPPVYILCSCEWLVLEQLSYINIY